MSENRMSTGDRHAACLDMTLGGAGGLGMAWGIDQPDTSNISSHGRQAVPKGPPDPLGNNFFSRKAMYACDVYANFVEDLDPQSLCVYASPSSLSLLRADGAPDIDASLGRRFAAGRFRIN